MLSRMDLHSYNPMLPTRVPAFSSDAYLFEFKLDGYRIIAGHDGHTRALRARSGRSASTWFPEVIEALSALPPCILDGEVCLYNDEGRADFHRLAARRAGQSAARAGAVVYFAFDLLSLNGEDLRHEPIETRKSQLQELIGASRGVLRYVPHERTEGLKLMQGAIKFRQEGIIAKALGSRYQGGRTKNWLKFINSAYRRPTKASRLTPTSGEDS